MSTSEEYQIFIKRIADTLEVDVISLETTALSDFKEFDSMAVINISLLIEEMFDWEIPLEHLDGAGLALDLYAEIKKIVNQT